MIPLQVPLQTAALVLELGLFTSPVLIVEEMRLFWPDAFMKQTHIPALTIWMLEYTVVRIF